ncbi:MAG: bifunctional oligoribonuclease/PAP phosphatase NrnA [Clostridia bacterium]|nr:bifunctional oligoribonuclease/PAP phosphatase NrnA [Clostridia bacterium]
MNLEAAKRFVESHHDFLLAAHRSPDGDTLGSCLAFRLALLSMGKRATVVCVDPVPPHLSYLTGSETVVSSVSEAPEAAIYVDCACHSRADALEPVLDRAPYCFCIDHHLTNPCESKDGDWVESTGATAELIYRLLAALEVPITVEIAECLYTAIVTDTGNFAYSNTTPDTFRIAGELCKAGIDLPEINRRLFRTMPLRKARLIAHTLDTAEFLEDETAAIACITQQDLDACGATEADCEGLIDYLRDIETVEVACTLRESADGTIRGSLRAKRSADVTALAIRFGGGGHPRAAGFSLAGPMEAAKEKVVAALTALIQAWKASSMC